MSVQDNLPTHTIKVLSSSEFRGVFDTRNPDLKPKDKKVKINFVPIYILTAILFSVNVLSAGHTIPTIQKFYHDISPLVLGFIGFFGFLGIEGTIVYLMAQEERKSSEWAAILFAFLAALGSNVYATSLALNGEGELTTLILGAIFGFFAPFANIAIGEVFHKRNVQINQLKLDAEKKYRENVAEYEQQFQKSYRTYLSRVGIKEEGDKMFLINGGEPSVLIELGLVIERNGQEYKAITPTQRSVPTNPAPSTNSRTSSRGRKKSFSYQELAEKLVANGDGDLKYAEILEKYPGATTNKIAKAKRLIKEKTA